MCDQIILMNFKKHFVFTCEMKNLKEKKFSRFPPELAEMLRPAKTDRNQAKPAETSKTDQNWKFRSVSGQFWRKLQTLVTTPFSGWCVFSSFLPLDQVTCFQNTFQKLELLKLKYCRKSPSLFFQLLLSLFCDCVRTS